MSKHTPGPWEILSTLEICSGNKDICELKGWMNEDQANARLIAAAPDLLEALKLMVDTYDNGGWPSSTLVIARAAIDKAKGEV